MATFLLKTEPGEYSYDDLARDKRTTWTGVRHPAALAAIRSMGRGDEALIYHTGSVKAIVGLAKVASSPYEDPGAPGLNAEGAPKHAVVDLEPVRAAPTPVTLEQIKADKRFAEFALVRQSRLSVMPVPATLDKLLRKWSGL